MGPIFSFLPFNKPFIRLVDYTGICFANIRIFIGQNYSWILSYRNSSHNSNIANNRMIYLQCSMRSGILHAVKHCTLWRQVKSLLRDETACSEILHIVMVPARSCYSQGINAKNIKQDPTIKNYRGLSPNYREERWMYVHFIGGAANYPLIYADCLRSYDSWVRCMVQFAEAYLPSSRP